MNEIIIYKMYVRNIQRNVVLNIDYNNKDTKARMKNIGTFKSINDLISNIEINESYIKKQLKYFGFMSYNLIAVQQAYIYIKRRNPDDISVYEFKDFDDVLFYKLCFNFSTKKKISKKYFSRMEPIIVHTSYKDLKHTIEKNGRFIEENELLGSIDISEDINNAVGIINEKGPNKIIKDKSYEDLNLKQNTINNKFKSNTKEIKLGLFNDIQFTLSKTEGFSKNYKVINDDDESFNINNDTKKEKHKEFTYKNDLDKNITDKKYLNKKISIEDDVIISNIKNNLIKNLSLSKLDINTNNNNKNNNKSNKKKICKGSQTNSKKGIKLQNGKKTSESLEKNKKNIDSYDISYSDKNKLNIFRDDSTLLKNINTDTKSKIYKIVKNNAIELTICSNKENKHTQIKDIKAFPINNNSCIKPSKKLIRKSNSTMGIYKPNNNTGEDLFRKTLKTKNNINSRINDRVNFKDNLIRDGSNSNTRNQNNINTIISKLNNSSFVKNKKNLIIK